MLSGINLELTQLCFALSHLVTLLCDYTGDRMRTGTNANKHFIFIVKIFIETKGVAYDEFK